MNTQWKVENDVLIIEKYVLEFTCGEYVYIH